MKIIYKLTSSMLVNWRTWNIPVDVDPGAVDRFSHGLGTGEVPAGEVLDWDWDCVCDCDCDCDWFCVPAPWLRVNGINSETHETISICK